MTLALISFTLLQRHVALPEHFFQRSVFVFEVVLEGGKYVHKAQYDDAPDRKYMNFFYHLLL